MLSSLFNHPISPIARIASFTPQKYYLQDGCEPLAVIIFGYSYEHCEATVREHRRKPSVQSRTVQSVFFDNLERGKLSWLQRLSIKVEVFCGISLRKILPLMGKIRELCIDCYKAQDEEAFQEVCAAATNLESIELITHRSGAPVFQNIPKKVLDAFQTHPKLKLVRFHGDLKVWMEEDSLREAVQYMSHRRIYVTFDDCSFLYGKRIGSGCIVSE